VTQRGLWVGTYSGAIWHVLLDEDTGALSGAGVVAESAAPSFLALHPGGHTLYAVAEVDDGRVTAFAVGPDGALAPRGPARSSGGAAPCHVVATDAAVVVTNYGGGTVGCLPLHGDGALAGDAQVHHHRGAGPDPERQDGPHPHSATAVDGEFWVADLGTDELRRYRRAGAGVAPAGVAAVLPAGAGPRHVAALPGGALAVATELDAGVHVVAGGRSVARVDAAASVDVRSYPSHLAVVGGDRLYVAVRGADVLATFAVGAGPDGPRLVHRHDTPVPAWPRHFAVVPTVAGDLVVVAGQEASELVVLRFAPGEGGGTLVARLSLPQPACVLPVRPVTRTG
jgi:6-phosphogluconolactonase